MVDRGWLATDNSGTEPVDVPAPPSGEVTVTGWVRVDATGDSTVVSAGSTGDTLSTRSISSDRIGEAIDREVYGGFVDLKSEDPAPETPLEPAELPELDNGPHFFYGLQWWFFGAAGDLGLQLPRVRRVAQAATFIDVVHRARSIPPSTGTMAPLMNDAAGESRKAAVRPNSSGSP